MNFNEIVGEEKRNVMEASKLFSEVCQLELTKTTQW
jgi:hypothetical protein